MSFAGRTINFQFIAGQYMKPVKGSKQRKMSLDMGIQVNTRLASWKRR